MSVSMTTPCARRIRRATSPRRGRGRTMTPRGCRPGAKTRLHCAAKRTDCDWSASVLGSNTISEEVISAARISFQARYQRPIPSCRTPASLTVNVGRERNTCSRPSRIAISKTMTENKLLPLNDCIRRRTAPTSTTTKTVSPATPSMRARGYCARIVLGGPCMLLIVWHNRSAEAPQGPRPIGSRETQCVRAGLES